MVGNMTSLLLILIQLSGSQVARTSECGEALQVSPKGAAGKAFDACTFRSTGIDAFGQVRSLPLQYKSYVTGHPNAVNI